MKFLIVDSDRATSTATLRMMDILRFDNVFQVSSGNEAIANVNCESYDCILIDSALEDMSGSELIQYIRNDKTLDDMAIIAILNTEQQHLVDDVANAGANTTVTRPFSAGILQQLIRG